MNVQTRIYGQSAYVMLQWKRKVFKFFTGVRVDPLHFDERTGLVSSHLPDAMYLQRAIDEWRIKLLTTAMDLDRRGLELSQALIRRQFTLNLEIKTLSESTISDLLDKYAVDRRDELSRGSILVLERMARVLRYYESKCNVKLLVNEFTEQTARELQRHLLHDRRVNNNTVYSYMGRVRTVLRYYKPESSWSFVKYDAYKPEVVFLFDSEIKALEDADLDGFKARTRDLLLFSCYTGMRYSDTQNYSPSWESQGLIIYRQQKTDSEAMLPLFKNAKRILERYGGKPPRTSSQLYNIRLKELFLHLKLSRPVAQTVVRGKNKTRTNFPLHEVISSHIGRKTFIMQALMKGVSTQDVMDMSGHSDYRAMTPYITRHRAHLKKLDKLWDNE